MIDRHRLGLLALIIASFVAVDFVLQEPPRQWYWVLLRALVFWTGIGLQGSMAGAGHVTGLFLRFCAGTGLVLVYHAMLTYTLRIQSDPKLLLAESLASTAALALAELVFPEKRNFQKLLIAGEDPLAGAFLSGCREPVLGSVGVEYPEIPYLGGFSRLEEVLAGQPYTTVVAGSGAASAVSPRVLWQLPGRGIPVQTAGALYEQVLKRVPVRALQVTDLVLSPALRANSRVMAIQAIYSNLTGLALLAILSPILLAASLLILLSGPGPILESIECAGFQKIPFRLLRFRTLRGDGSGMPTRAGKAIAALRLENLPQVVNIVRGEMTLFGPAPVRRLFAIWLTEALPFYGHRFSVKPGILGWGQVHTPPHDVMEELSRLEYDLYYIKNGSPLLDFDILLQTIASWVSRGSARQRGQARG